MSFKYLIFQILLIQNVCCLFFRVLYQCVILIYNFEICLPVLHDIGFSLLEFATVLQEVVAFNYELH